MAMRVAALCAVLMAAGSVAAQTTGYAFEGACIASRSQLAELQCATRYPTTADGRTVSCIAVNGVEMTLEMVSLDTGAASYRNVAANAPACQLRGIPALEAIRWGNAAHVAQAILAAVMFGLFAHGYLVGQRE